MFRREVPWTAGCALVGFVLAALIVFADYYPRHTEWRANEVKLRQILERAPDQAAARARLKISGDGPLAPEPQYDTYTALTSGAIFSGILYALTGLVRLVVWAVRRR